MFRATAVIVLLLLPLTTLASDWPGWRGPGGQGVSSEKHLPLEWSAKKGVRWKAVLPGAGVSAPIVHGERVFVTASDGRRNERLHVLCYQRDDGRLLWHTRLFGSAPTDNYPPGGMAVSTAAADSRAVYVLFGTGDLAALDHEGRPLWIRSLAEEHGPFANRWGMAASPILADGTLYVLVDHWSRSYLLAVDTRTGGDRWKADRPHTAVNWTSPLVTTLGGRRQIVAVGTHQIRGYDADGRERWHVGGLHQQCIPSPVTFGDLVIVSSGEGTLAVRPGDATGDLTKSKAVVWCQRKAAGYIASPLVYGREVYLPISGGFCLCLDAATGKQRWKERLGDPAYASPVAGAGRIYCATKEGAVKVLRAGSTFELLADNPMGEPLVASPALADGQIFLRGERHLFCVGDRRKE